jgi:hypothetical protein
MAGRLPVPPPPVDRGGSLLRRPGGRCRQQPGELAPAVVVVHYDQVPARAQDAQHLRQACLGPRRKEVGEPCVYHVHARVRQRDVLGGAGQNLCSRQADCRPFSCRPQSRVGLHANDACCLGGILPEPVASAAAQVHEGPAGPGSNGAHRGQHVPGLVDSCILQLVATWVAADVRREPPVRELRGSDGSNSHAELSAISNDRCEFRGATGPPAERGRANHPPGAVSAAGLGWAGGGAVVPCLRASIRLMTSAASWTVWMP